MFYIFCYLNSSNSWRSKLQFRRKRRNKNIKSYIEGVEVGEYWRVRIVPRELENTVSHLFVAQKMCDASDKGQKWKCEICTYENYPSSLKCTMCQASKPLLNEDIFR